MIWMLFGRGATGAELQVKAEVNPVDFSICRFECLSLKEESIGFGKRLSVEPGDSLALLVHEVLVRIAKK
jgi:hypothetical protein